MSPVKRCSSFDWLIVLSIAVIYYLAAKVGSWFAIPIPPANVTAVWLPSPLSWSVILLRGYRIGVCGIWLGDFAYSLGSYLSSDYEGGWKTVGFVCLAGLTALGSVLEASLGVFLIRRSVKRATPLDRVADIGQFVAFAILCPALNALYGVTLFCLAGTAWSEFLSLWLTWWLGNAVSLIVFTPTLLIWFSPHRRSQRSWNWAEVVVCCGMSIGISIIAFRLGYPLEYLLIPCLIWAVFRFGLLGATTGVALVSVIALWGTAHGTSVFIRPAPNESLLLLQTFIGSISITVLFLGALLHQWQESQYNLAEANERLELRIAQRTTQLTQTNKRLSEQIADRQQTELILRQTLDELQQTQAKLIQTEKMSSLGQLVAGVAHEINNPINFIYGNLVPAQTYIRQLLACLQLYEQEYPHPSPSIQLKTEEIDLLFIQEDLPCLMQSMQVGAERIREIVKSLRIFSRLDEAEFKAVDLHEGIDSALMILQNRLKARSNRNHIAVIKRYGDLPLIECYARQLNQVFMNILSNAIDALEPQVQVFQPATITIHTAVEQDHAVIVISDNGPGIPRELQGRLFDPFFTTKPIGKGVGLGLSTSYQIVVDQHGGDLQCDSAQEPGSGTKFWIKIPIQQ